MIHHVSVALADIKILIYVSEFIGKYFVQRGVLKVFNVTGTNDGWRGHLFGFPFAEGLQDGVI